MHNARLTLLSAAFAVGMSGLLISGHAQAQAVTEECRELEEATREATAKAIEEIHDSEDYKQVEEERVSAFDCQMAVSGELSSWVKGNVSMGFLDQLYDQMADRMSKEACDQFKARAREANQRLQELERAASDALANADKASKEIGDRLDEYAITAPQQPPRIFGPGGMPTTPHVQTPGYNSSVPQSNTNADPWASVRNLWGNK